MTLHKGPGQCNLTEALFFKWLPLQDSNLDKLIQSQLCYHYTKRQRRGGIIGASPRERKRKKRRAGAGPSRARAAGPGGRRRRGR